jgi:transcription elongation factor
VPQFSNPWWNDENCVPHGNKNEACCPAEMIGNPYGNPSGYYYWDIEFY